MTRLSADKTTALLVYFCHVFFGSVREKGCGVLMGIKTTGTSLS